MDPSTRCPDCGRTLEEPGAACPKCLLNLALETSSGGGANADPGIEAERLGAGSRVGPYEIVEEIGEGGMGVVYLARQKEPIRRRVALKVVKRGMDTEQVVRRFDAERQALALMDHDVVARVYDAGETAAGRPYFAMEYIEGEPVTAYCTRRNLGTEQRLRLFAQVCAGVQHAHRRGIIHRDLKPSNVLVAEVDGEPRPKIIDFGIAKATEQSLTDRSALTSMGVLLGTPEYMSPEQADLAPFDVDTRTDVYSLGVILYELLAGTKPFDLGSLERTTFEEVRRQIREVRPPRPGTHRKLPADLDLIVMKALEKERDRRYGSPAELADDIRRHLDRQPVLARPSSTLYELRKLAARNPLVTALLALIVVLAVAGTVVNVAQTRKTRVERDRATREAETARTVSSFLEDLFAGADPRVSRGADVSVRDVLDMGAKRVEEELTGQPEVQTRLLILLGNIYNSLGSPDEGLRLLRRSEELGAGVLEAQPALDVERLRSVGWIHRDAGRLDEALEFARRALGRAEADLDPAAPIVTESLMLLGVVERDRGDLEQAQATLERALNAALEHQGEMSAPAGWTLFHLGWLEHLLGRDEEAAANYERACTILEQVLKKDEPGTATCFNDHATVLQSLRRFDEAAEKLQRAIEIWERVLPPGHPKLAQAISNLGTQAYYQGDYATAERHYLRALEIRETALGSDHPEFGGSLCNVAVAYRNMGRLDDAERYYLRGIAVIESAVGPDSPHVVSNLIGLASIYDRQGRFAEALAIYQRAVASRERTHGPDHPWTAGALRSAAADLLRLGRGGAAVTALERANEIARANFPAEQKGTRSMALDLAYAYQKAGRAERAREVALEALETGERAGLQDEATAHAQYVLARLDLASGRTREALDRLRLAVEARGAVRPETDPTLLYYRAVEAAHAGEPGQALELLGESLESGYSGHDVDTELDLAPLRERTDLSERLRERLPPAESR